MTHSRLFTGCVWLATAAIAAAQTAVPDRLTLDEALRFAFQHSPELRGSRAEVAAARAERSMARAQTGPQLSLNGFASRSSMASILTTPMGSEPPAFVLAPEDDFIDGNLTFMAPLYTGGLLSGRVSAASAKVNEMLAMDSEMGAGVAFMVREAYLRALYGKELVEAQKSRVAAAQAMVAVAQAQLDAGKGIEAMVRRAEAERADAQRELTMAEAERRKMLLDLLSTMGSSMESLPELTERLNFSRPARTVDESIALAKKSRGELLAAHQRVQGAKGRIQSANGALQPQVYAFAMGDAFGPKDPMGKSSGYSYGLTLSLPLFDGGMRRSEASAARAMADVAKADEARIALKVEKEVRQAWLDIETAEQNYLTSQSALAGAQSAYDVMAIRVESGKGIQLELLDALATLTRARANVAQSLYEHQIAVAQLDRAIGIVEPNTSGVSKS